MMMRNNRLPLLVIAVTVLAQPGCASDGAGQSGAFRPTFGGLPFIQPRTTVIPRASGPIIQPEPGPALPDARSFKWPARFPGSAALRRRPLPVNLPAITPRLTPGAPVATNSAPAALSGGIEIVPGPSIRARRSQMEMHPSPLTDQSNSGIEILPSPVGARLEKLAPE